MIQPIKFDDSNSVLIILDQTALPNAITYLHLKTKEDIWDAIYHLKVRGAPAIGITAAYGVYLAVKHSTANKFHKEFMEAKAYLSTARPTAVNLFWALERMASRIANINNISEALFALREEAALIQKEDEENCGKIGEHGLTLLQPGWGILTHCNAGILCASKYGTATAPIYKGNEQEYSFKVFADETRPLLQGARLTAWELFQAGIDITVICDNMASMLMKQGKIQAVLVGCDRVARNGDTANKIGTSGVAVLAKHYKIPFFVCSPLSTIDLACPTGDDIPIELRSESEIREHWYKDKMIPDGVKIYNPAFDVTDNNLITAFITEKGIAYPPFSSSLTALK